MGGRSRLTDSNHRSWLCWAPHHREGSCGVWLRSCGWFRVAECGWTWWCDPPIERCVSQAAVGSTRPSQHVVVIVPPLPSPPPPRPTPLWTCHPHRPSNTYTLLPTTTFPQVHLDQPCNALRTRILSSSRNARSLLTKPPHCLFQSWKKIVFELWICWLGMDSVGGVFTLDISYYDITKMGSQGLLIQSLGHNFSLWNFSWEQSSQFSPRMGGGSINLAVRVHPPCRDTAPASWVWIVNILSNSIWLGHLATQAAVVWSCEILMAGHRHISTMMLGAGLAGGLHVVPKNHLPHVYILE